MHVYIVLKKYLRSVQTAPSRNSLVFCVLATLFLLINLLPSCAGAKEDTALLSFQKLLPAEQLGKPYVIREGDTLYAIIRSRLGIRSAKGFKEAMELIKKLNPNLTDPRKLRPGQSLILPEMQFAPEKDPFGVETVFYKVKKGDSLEKILMTQLNVKRSQMTAMLHNIKEMNPRLSDVDRITVNQVLRLPDVKTSSEEAGDSFLTEGDNDPVIDPDKPIIISETLKRNLLLAGDILNRFKATLITDGQYYVPLAESGQITVDCASIPLVEFDDGSIVFIELKSRLPERVKKMIREHWSNYRFTTAHEKDTLISILQKVVNQSGSYRMKQGGRYAVGERLTVQITPGWTIQQTIDTGSSNPVLRHGLVFYKNASQSLPVYLLKNLSARGVALTEVALDSGIIRDKQDGLAPLAAPNLSGASKIDLIHNLLILLGQDAAKDVELSLYDKEKGGFNLTMRADIVLKKDNKQIIITFRKIPVEFADMLKKDGREILTLNDEDTKIKLVTKILNYLNVSYTFNYFRLTVNHVDNPEDPFISAIFPALQIYQADNFLYYLVDYPFDPDFFTYFKRLKEVSIIQY